MKYIYGLLLITLAATYLILSGQQEQPRGTTVKATSSIDGLRIINKKEGADIWVVTAQKAELVGNDTIGRMHAVQILAEKDGITVTADSGLYNMETRALTLSENIRIRTKDALISASSLAWDPAERVISSKERVIVDGERFRIEGDGLVASPDQKVQLMSNVKATFR